MGLFKLFGKNKNVPAAHTDEPQPLKKVDTATSSVNELRTEVEPELALWLSNGATVKSLQELATALKKMKAADYKEHVSPERNELAEWVQEVLNDPELAKALRKSKGKMQAAQQVEKEIKKLKAAAKEATKTIADKKEPEQDAGRVGRHPRLQAAKVELSLPEMTEIPEKNKRPIWPFKKKAKEEKTEPTADFSQLEIPQLPDENETPAIEDTLTPEPIREETPQNEKKAKGFFLFRKKAKPAKTPEIPLEQPIQPLETATQPVEDTFGASTDSSPNDTITEDTWEAEPHHASWTTKEEESTAEPAETRLPKEDLRPKQPTNAKQSRRKTAKPEEPQLESPEIQRHIRELDKQEREINTEEDELNAKKLELTKKRYEIIKQRGELERKRFDDFIKKHDLNLHEQSTILRTGLEQHPAGLENAETYVPENETRGLPDFRLAGAYGKQRLVELLEQAKENIRANNVEEAQQALEEVQSVFNTVFMTSSEKKQIEYEILEVEADLKLASLK